MLLRVVEQLKAITVLLYRIKHMLDRLCADKQYGFG